MKDYVDTKLTIFKELISYKRKPGVKKTAIININSDYADLFINETYDSIYTYGNNPKSNLKVQNIRNEIGGMKFDVISG